MGWTVYWSASWEKPWSPKLGSAIDTHARAVNERLSDGCETYGICKGGPTTTNGSIKIHYAAEPERDLRTIVGALKELSALLGRGARILVSDDYMLDQVDPNDVDFETLGGVPMPRTREDVPLPDALEDVRSYVRLLHEAALAGSALHSACYDAEVFLNTDMGMNELNAVEKIHNRLEAFRKKHRLAKPELEKKASKAKTSPKAASRRDGNRKSTPRS